MVQKTLKKKAAIPGKFQLPISTEILQTKTKNECDEEARETPRVLFQSQRENMCSSQQGINIMFCA